MLADNSEDMFEDANLIPLAALPNIKLPKYNINTNLPHHVKVITIRTPSCFFVHLKDQEEFFEDFLQNMNDYYNNNANNTPISSVNELPLHSHWCVYFEGSWLRAKVEKNLCGKLSLVDDTNILCFEMFFVDYGFRKIINLDDIYYLQEEFTFDPPFAIACRLAEVFPLPENKWNINPWPDDTLISFYFLFLDEKYCQAIFSSNIPDYVSIDTILELFDGTVVNEELVKYGFAASTVIQKFITNSLDPLEERNESKSPDERKDTELSEERLDTISSEEDYKSSEKKYTKSDEGNELLDKWDPMLDDFYSKNNTIYHDNESLQSIYFGIENDDESKICKYFKNGLKCPRGEIICPKQHKMLRDDGLPNGVEYVYYELEEELDLPTEGCIKQVRVTHINNPQNFFVYIPENGYDGDVLEELEANLYLEYGNSQNSYLPILPSYGELMVARVITNFTKKFYRVRVLEIYESEESIDIEVFFIDYGDIVKINEKDLYPFKPQFLRPPALAIACYLEDIIPNENNWNDDSINFFKENLQNKLLTTCFCYHTEYGECGVMIFHPIYKEKTINEIMVENTFGKFVNN